MGTTAVEVDGAFQEVFILGVTKKGGSEVQFASISEFDSLDPKEGDKEGEGVALGNGGRMWKRTPEGDFEFTVKIYPLSVDVTDAQDLSQYFLGGTYDSVAPISQVNTRARDLFRVAIMWTDDPSPSTAAGTTGPAWTARRITVKDCRITGYKEGFDDGILSAEVTFKAPAFNLTGTGNITRESTLSDDGAGLPALAAYS